MKPLQTRWHNERLAAHSYERRLMARVLQAWIGDTESQLDAYRKKTKATDLLWARLKRSWRVEKKRAFRLWRAKAKHLRQQSYILRRVITRNDFDNKQCAFLVWKSFSDILEHECRVVLLKRELAERMYLTGVFSNLKQWCLANRQHRLRAMGHAFKGWRKYQALRRYKGWAINMQ